MFCPECKKLPSSEKSSLIRKQLDSMAIYWVNLEKVIDECHLKENALKQTEIRKASGNVSCVMKAIEFNLFKFS